MTLHSIMPHRFSLNTKLIGFALLLVGFTMVVALVSVIRGQVLKTKNDVQLLYADLLKAHSTAALLLHSRKETEAQKVREACGRFQETLRSYPHEWFTAELLAGMQRFKATFEQVDAKLRERGYDENSGTEGAFRRNAHQLQYLIEALEKPQLSAILLEARRREKDYFLRRDTVYAAKVRGSILALINAVAVSGLSVEKQYDMHRLALGYLQEFEHTVLLLEEIALLESTLQKEFDAIEPIIRRIETLKQEESAAQEQQTLAITVLSILVSLIAAFVLARRISAPIVALQHASERLAGGDYSAYVETTSHDEIADLGQVFNGMIGAVRERTEQLHESYASLRILSSIGRTLASTLEQERIVNVLYHNVVQLMPVDVFGIGIYNKHHQYIEDVLTIKNGAKTPLPQTPLSNKNSLAVWSLQYQSELVINDYANEYSRYTQEMYVPKDILNGQEYPQSLLFMPLLVVDESIGVLTVQCFRRNAFSPHHVDIMRTLAGYAAAALHNAHAYTTVQEQNTEIMRQQELLAEQAATIQIANTELQERNMQLEALNQEKNEFLGIAAHDLKNPLTSIQMNASMIEQFYDKLSKDELIERAEVITATSKRMSEIITNLLDINAIETGNLHLKYEDVDMHALALQIADDYKARADQKQLQIDVSPRQSENATFMAKADSQAMSQVLDNLISNAVKYSPPGKQIWVRVQDRERRVRVEVQDEGQGISSEEMAKLFGKFVRLSTRPTGGEQSTGLGLSIAKRMVEAMSGRVWCESEHGKGAMFIVEMPTV